jgi:hypothetical protein
MGNNNSYKQISGEEDRIIVFAGKGGHYLTAQDDGSYYLKHDNISVSYDGEVQGIEEECYAHGVGILTVGERKYVGIFEQGHFRRGYRFWKNNISKGKFNSYLALSGVNNVIVTPTDYHVSNNVMVDGRLLSTRKIYNRQGYLVKSGAYETVKYPYCQLSPFGLINIWEIIVDDQGETKVQKFEEIYLNEVCKMRSKVEILSMEEYKKLSFGDVQKFEDLTPDKCLEEFKKMKF